MVMIYVDSSNCTPCSFKHLIQWHCIKNTLEKNGIGILLIFRNTDERAVIPDGYVFKAIDRQGNGHLGALEDYTLFITDKNFKLKSVGIQLLTMGNVLGGYNYLYDINSIVQFLFSNHDLF